MKMLNGTWLAYLEEIDTSSKEIINCFKSHCAFGKNEGIMIFCFVIGLSY